MTELKQFQADKPEFVKYPRIIEIGLSDSIPISANSIVSVFEKIDGGNCQIRRHKGRLLHGSRGSYITGVHTESVDWFKKFNKWFWPNYSLYNLPENLVVFGEWSGNHTIDYGDFNDKFVFLDLFDLQKERFMNYFEGVENLHENNIEGMRFFEPLFEGKVKDADIEKLVMEPSKHYTGPREGVVIKSYSHPQTFLKAYHPDFAETRDTKFLKDYLTSIRFRKVFHALREEGRPKVSIKDIVDAVRMNVQTEHEEIYSNSEIRRRLDGHIGDGKLSDLKFD